MSIGLYGRRVVGDEEFRRQQEVVQQAAQIYGPRVTGGRAAAETTTPPATATHEAPLPQHDVNLEAERLKQENEELRAQVAALRDQLQSALSAVAAGTPPAAGAADGEPQGGGPGEAATEPASGQNAGAEAGAEVSDEAVKAAAGADGYLSVSEIRAAVTANPALVDGFLEQELARQPKPRTSALRALLNAEQSEDGARRPEIVEKIKAALGEATR